MPKSNKSSSESSFDSSSESSSDSDRKISGQKSDSSDDDCHDSETDIKDQFLLDIFKPKPVKVEVSSWAKAKMRSAFLSTRIGKDELAKVRDDYYCSASDYQLFAPGKLADSPLAILTSNNSSANKDLLEIHGLLLFALRIGLISYEKILALAAMWAAESTVKETGKTIAAGPWCDLSYRFRPNLPVLVPHKARDKISDTEIDAFMSREFIEKAKGEEKLEVLARYAISYKDAFEKMRENAQLAHEDAIRLEDALNEVRAETLGLAKDTGTSMRLLGGVCQQVKAMREQNYSKSLDQNFKQYLSSKKRARTDEEATRARADPALLDSDLAKTAKNYGKLKRAMAQVTREKKKQKTDKTLQKKHNKGKKESGDAAPGPSGLKTGKAAWKRGKAKGAKNAKENGKGKTKPDNKKKSGKDSKDSKDE